MRVGQRIANLRKERNVQQKELAGAIGMNRIVLNRIELGKRPVRDDEIIKIADYFDVTCDYLLGHKEEKNRTLRNNIMHLNDDELKVLDIYRELNKIGKESAIAALEGLSNNEMFKTRVKQNITA